MPPLRRRRLSSLTIHGRRTVALVIVALSLVSACGRREAVKDAREKETVSRTEFTDRIENFFEFDALTRGAASSFLIHLTDLSDGSPVEQAQVTLTARPAGGGAPITAKARIGKVAGIYVAELSVPAAGDYAIEFHVKNAKLEERMPLT